MSKSKSQHAGREYPHVVDGQETTRQPHSDPTAVAAVRILTIRLPFVVIHQQIAITRNAHVELGLPLPWIIAYCVPSARNGNALSLSVSVVLTIIRVVLFQLLRLDESAIHTEGSNPRAIYSLH